MVSDPSSDAAIRAWARLVKAQQRALAAVEADLKAAGFPPLAWYDVLLELSRAEGNSLRPLEIEARLLLAQHNVSRLVDRLVGVGYVERRSCPGDKRGQLVAITPLGHALIKRMWPVYHAAIARHVGDKIGDDADQLATLLGRLLS